MSRASHFKIGLFVITGMALVIAGLVLLGAGVFEEEHFHFESYFDTSVEGLAVGSPVKFRGVEIGFVEFIDFASNWYEPEGKGGRTTLVLVRAALKRKQIPADIREYLEGTTEEGQLVLYEALRERGMRCRLTSSGLAGVPFLSLDYYDPQEYPTEMPPWEVEVPFLPAIPDIADLLVDTLDTFRQTLKETPIVEIGKRFEELLAVLTRKAEEVEMREIATRVVELLDEVRNTNQRLGEFVGNPALQQLPDDVATLIDRIDGTVEEVRVPVRNLLTDLSDSAVEVRATIQGVNRSVTHIEALLDSDAVKEGIPDTISELRLALMRVRQLVESQEDRIGSIIASLEAVAQNLEILTDDAKQHPARVLFGDPPPAATKGQD